MKSKAYRQHLVMMVKAPKAGSVKTRLAKGIGAVEALRFYRSTTTALARRLDGGKRWQNHLAITPDEAIRHPVWPAHFARRRQVRGDLGHRMQALFDDMPPGPVVIVGSDIPGITQGHIARAFRELGRADVVFGPAHDGGYWLIGCKRRPSVPALFERVRWSHPQTLNDTLANATGLTVAMIDHLEDIDEPEELESVQGWSGRVVLPPLRLRNRFTIHQSNTLP